MTPPKSYTRLIKRLYFIIALLLLVIVAGLYFFLKRDSLHSNFKERVPNKVAYEHIEKYRVRPTINKKTRIIWYEADDIKKYMNDTYPKLVGELNTPVGHRWVVGFYFMRKDNEQGYPRMDFYVVPTLLDPAGNPVDFADPEGRILYKYKDVTRSFDDDSLAANTGHIWP